MASDAFAELCTIGASILRACGLVGSARATQYRQARGRMHGPCPARVMSASGQALSQSEHAAVLTLINTPVYADLSINQIWVRELDAGS